MRKIALVLLWWILAGQLEAGRTLRIHTNTFSFLVTEPEGWIIDARSAVQIASLVMHKRGTTWREAEVVVFARFIEKAEGETLADFGKSHLDHLAERCPPLKIGDLTLKLAGKRKFLTKAYGCPEGRNEVVAFTELPGVFGVFILSSRDQSVIRSALGPFQEMLLSFRWLGEEDGPALASP